MKKHVQPRKLHLSKDTLRTLEEKRLDQAIGGEPTTTVLSHFLTCTCKP